MKRFCYVIKFWWGLIFFQPTDLHAARYFVATNGNDVANSGTINSPWRTFQRAANTALAGDTVFFRAGQYFERRIQLPNSGNAAQYITFKNFANEAVTFDGSAQRDSFLLIKNCAYIRVVGLHFRNLLGNDSFGVRIRGTSHHIELRKCSITNLYFSTNSGVPPDTSDNTHGIFITGESSTAMYAITVDSCEIKDCRTGQSEAITVVGNVRDFKITHCRINNTGNIGIVVAGF
ncbi:MAG: hypothetical protein R2822_11955 [Spirosomataceae bacterium]